MSKFSTLDLFAGAGGLTLGFKDAGFECSAAVEIDSASVQTFSSHTPSATIFEEDICNITLENYKGEVDVVIGGPPCQPFSSGGLREAENDLRDMVPEFIRAIEEVHPRAFVMENVPGLSIGERIEYFGRVILEFRNLGYNVSWKVLNAEEYGVPQKRRRLFIVGMKDGQFEFPEPSHGIGKEKIIVAGDILSIDPKGEPNLSKITYAKKVDLRPSPYHGLLFNGGGRAINLAEPAPTIISSAGGNKTHFLDCLNVVPKYHSYLMGGGKPKDGEVPGARRITVVESALLQTFPGTLTFAGGGSAQYRQIGNAVPPRLASAIAHSLWKHMSGEHSQMQTSSSVQGTLFGQEIRSIKVNAKKSLSRNQFVEKSVRHALGRVDDFLSGEDVKIPAPANRRLIDEMLSNYRGSVRLATLYLLYYWIIDPTWDRKTVPQGTRGTYGDKLFAEELNKRGITLHDNITAYGENLGWKGNVRNFDLSQDSRFAIFREIGEISGEEKIKVADYLASRFAESQVVTAPLPAVGRDVLTFARAKHLLHSLIRTPSEGHIQQYLIAALLFVHRKRYGYDVITHHSHASDKFDRTAGDIEEKLDGQLVRAFEVTARPDWKNRISNFKDKMDRFGLQKYIIIAANVNNDPEWSIPARIITNLEPYGRDIAVVDIDDFVNVFSAELTARELREAVNKGFEYLINPKLCGRVDIISNYRDTVSKWLDEV